MIELTGQSIRAFPYRNCHRLRARALPDGAIVERPTRALLGHVPVSLPAYSDAAETDNFAPLTGVFILNDGMVAAVYGAKAEAVGSRRDGQPPS